MANNHLKRLATHSITITLIMIVAVLTSVLPLGSMEHRDTLGFTGEAQSISETTTSVDNSRGTPGNASSVSSTEIFKNDDKDYSVIQNVPPELRELTDPYAIGSSGGPGGASNETDNTTDTYAEAGASRSYASGELKDYQLIRAEAEDYMAILNSARDDVTMQIADSNDINELMVVNTFEEFYTFYDLNGIPSALVFTTLNNRAETGYVAISPTTDTSSFLCGAYSSHPMESFNECLNIALAIDGSIEKDDCLPVYLGLFYFFFVFNPDSNNPIVIEAFSKSQMPYDVLLSMQEGSKRSNEISTIQSDKIYKNPPISTIPEPRQSSAAVAKTVSNVPAYSWYRGCSTTTLAMILSYYGLEHGYTAFAEQPDNFTWTRPKDWEWWLITLPDWDCQPFPSNIYIPRDLADDLADELGISENCGIGADFGSRTSQQVSAVESVAEDYGYYFCADELEPSDISTFMSEIDAGRPVKIGYNVAAQYPTEEGWHAVAGWGYSEVSADEHILYFNNTWDLIDNGTDNDHAINYENALNDGFLRDFVSIIPAGIIDIKGDGLNIDEWGTVSIDAVAPHSNDYYVKVFNQNGWPPPWEWASTSSSELHLNRGELGTFTFTVKPDSLSEGFQFWFYERVLGPVWRIIDKVSITLEAEGQDTTPPTVLNHNAGTVPGTNIYVTFSEDMNDSTFTNSNIIVSGSSSGIHPCSFSFDHSSYELTINPSSDFSYGEEVTVTIGTGVQDLAGNSLMSTPPFIFTIQNEPPDPPSYIYISSMSLSPSTVDPHEQFEVSGYAEYDTGSPVDVGTANIVISSDGGSWTTPVTDGTFSTHVQAPGNDSTSSITRSVTVTVSDGSVTPDSESRTLTIRGVEPENYYEFTTALTCENVQQPDVDPITIKPAFSKDDDWFQVWVRLEMLYKSVQVRWEWYSPDGLLDSTTYSDWTDDPQDHGWEYYYWWNFSSGYGLRNPAGGYWLHAGSEGDWRCDVSVKPEGGSFEHVATVDFTVRYDLIEHKMCKGLDGNDDPDNPTNTFSPSDSKAMTWARYAYVSDPLEIKWVFNSPEGFYDEFTYTSDDPGEDSWYPWVKAWGWIDIAGWPAAYKCGDWYVDVFVKDAWNNYERKYTDYFRIEEGTPPSVSVLAAPPIPIETQNVVIDVSAWDNNHLKKIVLHWNDGSDHTQTWDNIDTGSYSPSHPIGSFSGGQMVSYWAEAWDESGNRFESEHHSFTVQEEVVTVPDQPAGESYRQSGQSGSYQTGGSTTNLGNSVEYQFDWGDTTQSAWGDSTQSHSWLDEGPYFMKARARCQTHTSRISDWSQSFTVVVDSTAPMVEITTNDGNDFSTAETQIVLEGITYDPEPASGPDSVTISTGDPNEGTSSNWLFTVDLNDGPNELMVTATDRAGNSASDTIIITRANTLTLNLKAGWNMVSIPVTPTDNSTSAVFPGVAGIFAWNATSRSYYVPTVIDPKEGYWVAVTENTTMTISGTPIETWTTDIKAGWNMIGSVITIASIAAPNDNPDGSVIPTAYWWDPVGKSYILTTDIEPGKGYWIASVNDCVLTL